MKRISLKTNRQNAGFTLMEVMVAIIIAAGFIGFSFELMLISVLMRYKAAQRDAATAWISQDIEVIYSQAKKLDSGTCGVYGQNLRDKIGAITENADYKQLNIRLERNITNNQDSLNLHYSAFAEGSSKPIFTQYTEVIPYDALQNCQ